MSLSQALNQFAQNLGRYHIVSKLKSGPYTMLFNQHSLITL